MGWTLLRIAGIVVGIATLLRLATSQGLVTYDPIFQEWMNRLRDIVELGFLTDVIKLGLDWAIELIRSFGWHLPDLQEVWRPVFVINMLMLGATARHSRRWWFIPLAPFLAVVTAVYSGLTSDQFSGLLIAAAFAVFFGLVGRSVDVVGVILAFVGLALAGIIIGACMSYGVASTFDGFGAGAVGVFGVFVGAIFLWNSIIENWRRGYRKVFADAEFNSGIDILGVMLGALFMASLFANPPIW